MDWIIKNIITNKKFDRILYGLLIAIIIVDFLTDKFGNPDKNLIGFNFLLIALLIVGAKELMNYSYKKLYFSNQSNLNSIRELINNRQYSKAIDLTEKIRLVKPQLTEKLYWRGVANLYLKESSLALADFNSIEAEYSNFAGFFYHKGLALVDTGKNTEAIKYLSRSVELEKTWQNLDQRGVVNMNIDKLEEAEKDLRESIELKEDSSNTCNLGVLLDKKGNHTQAMEFYNRSIEINAENPNAFYNRALANYYIEKYQDSILDNTKAIELEPDRHWAYYNRALSKQKINELESAIDDFDYAEKLGIDNNYLYLNRGFCKCEFGDISNGLIDLKKADNLDCKEAKELIEKYDKQ